MDHLGLDLGTTTISAAVLDADGRLLCTRTVPGGAAVAGQPWERKQDARGIEHATLSLLDGLLQEFPDIGCVGLTGQMHGIVYVDAAGQLLSPLYTWQDETGAQPGPDGKSMAARLTARTGYPLASGYGLVTLACHQAAGTIPDGAAAVCTIADYLAMRLSGRSTPRLTPSMAASLGLFDGTDFDRKAVRRAGLPERLSPRLRLRPRHARLPSGSRNHPGRGRCRLHDRGLSRHAAVRPKHAAPHAIHGRQPRPV